MKNVFVYQLENLADEVANKRSSEEMKVIRWTPGLNRFIPPNSPFGYFYFWLMHFLNFFKSDHYRAYVIYVDEIPVSSLVCVPSLYRWPFMKVGDVQIKNVFTHQDYRGNGFAYRLVRYAIMDIGLKGRSFWYMTDEENIPSQKLCQKIGFKFRGKYLRERNKFFIYQGEIIKE